MLYGLFRGDVVIREEEDINIFLNRVASLHCNHLKYDIDTFISSVAKELVDKWSIKPSLAM